MHSNPRHFYEFGSFRLDADKHRLLRDGELVPLSPKAIEALLVLVQNPGKLLERDALMQAVWADTFVEDANLTVAISHLRKALGQNGETAEYIETVPRVGYRFVADVREILEEPAPLIIEKRTLSHTVIEEEEIQGDASNVAARLSVTQTVPVTRIEAGSLLRRLRLPVLVASLALVAVAAFWWIFRDIRGTAHPRIGSIAVLPFKVIGPDGDSREGAGLADVLITRLSNLRQIKVRPTSFVSSSKNEEQDSTALGKSLNVDAVLEGTIYRTSNKVRVTTRLLKVSDGSAIWTGQFEKLLNDEFRIHAEITEQVVETLALSLSRGEKNALAKPFTESPDAYQLYLRGRYEWNKRTWAGTMDAQRMFRNAIEKDPNFALAYVGLADSIVFGTANSDQVLSAVQRALELDPNLAEAYATLGFLRTFHQWDWEQAENSFQKAIELNPNYGTAHHWYAQLLAIQGRNAEAKTEMQRALEINPLSHNYLADLGQIHYFNREYKDAEEYCRKALEIYPDFIFAHEYLYDIYLKTGEYDRAVESLAAADKQFKSLGNESVEHHKQAVEGLDVQKKLYRYHDIREFLERRTGNTQDANVSYDYATIHSFMGEKEKAIACLEKAYAGRGFLSVFIKADPVFDPLRDDPRYLAILKKMRLN